MTKRRRNPLKRNNEGRFCPKRTEPVFQEQKIDNIRFYAIIKL